VAVDRLVKISDKIFGKTARFSQSVELVQANSGDGLDLTEAGLGALTHQFEGFLGGELQSLRVLEV
jgi:hypothetical protein